MLYCLLPRHYQPTHCTALCSPVLPIPPPPRLQPKHCALSLVGEPIMYPEINALVRLLHGRGLSTFLVTNAQVQALLLLLQLLL